MPAYILPKTNFAATTIKTPTPAEAEKPKGMARSIPTRLEIPDAGVATDLIQLGQNEDGTLETPTDYVHAGWYKYSPTPGEIGPAVITGHVDNYLGPAVFFYLKELQPGQPIHITREDGTVANFKVDRVELFAQDAFPTQDVYGNIDYPGLRLITCGGTFNAFTGHYNDNIVVYATFVSS
jgi:sortase (surface protein transpeptidase)